MSEMNDTQTLRDLSELLGQLSKATGLSESTIQSEMSQLDYTAFQFNDAILVSPSDFEGLIDAWALKLKADLRNGVAVATAPKAAKKAKTRKIKPATTQKMVVKKDDDSPVKLRAKKPRKTATKSTAVPVEEVTIDVTAAAATPQGLPLPEDYRSIVSHLYGPSLQRIMPAGEAEQKEFLSAIANETDAGVELLNHLAVIIAEKYSGKMAPEAAYRGLKNKALAFLDGSASPVERKKAAKAAKAKEPAAKPGRKAATKPGRKVAVKTEAKPGRKVAAKAEPKKVVAKPGRKPGRKPTGRTAKGTTAKKSQSASSAAETSVVLSEMELPKGYRKTVSNRYGPTLKSVLPEDEALRKAYLKEIASETNLGKSFLQRVADSIKLKYRGKITSHTAYQGLLDKAQAM